MNSWATSGGAARDSAIFSFAIVKRAGPVAKQSRGGSDRASRRELAGLGDGDAVFFVRGLPRSVRLRVAAAARCGWDANSA